MKDNRRNIDEFFQEELGSFTEMPPSSVWESLEKRLDGKESDKPKGFWWLYLLLAFVLISGSIAAYLTISDNQTTLQASKNNSNRSIEFKTKDQSINQANSNKKEELNSQDFTGLSGQSVDNEDESNFGSISNTNAHSTANSSKDIDADGQGVLAGDRAPASASIQKSNSRKPNSAENRKNSPKKEANERASKQDLNKISGKEEQNKTRVNNEDNNLSQTASTDKKATSANSIESNSKTSKKSLGRQVATNSKTEFSTGITDIDKKKSDALLASGTKKSSAPLIAEKTAPKKPTVAQNSKDKGRGLSAFPEEDEADLLTVEPAKEKDTDFEPEEPAKEKPATKLLLQSEAIGKLRAQNPLAAAPLATKEIDETTDEEGKEIKGGSSGGGGGGAASKQKEKAKKSLNMAIGVKFGYERGMQKWTAGKYVGTIFAEVNMSPKLSFVMQPSLKFGTANREITGASLDTFINADAVQSSQVGLVDSFGKPTGFYDYYISQRYDSMTQTASFQKKFLEIEIPFLFRYKVDKNLSVLAGINFIFGKTLGFTTSDRILSSSVLYDSIKNVFDTVKPSIPGKFFAQGASGKSNAMSELASPISPIRFGYTLGLSYVFRERVMVDLIVQQNLSGTSSISNAEVRKIFDQPYVRLSLGYTIFGQKKK